MKFLKKQFFQFINCASIKECFSNNISNFEEDSDPYNNKLMEVVKLKFYLPLSDASPNELREPSDLRGCGEDILSLSLVV